MQNHLQNQSCMNNEIYSTLMWLKLFVNKHSSSNWHIPDLQTQRMCIEDHKVITLLIILSLYQWKYIRYWSLNMLYIIHSCIVHRMLNIYHIRKITLYLNMQDKVQLSLDTCSNSVVGVNLCIHACTSIKCIKEVIT